MNSNVWISITALVGLLGSILTYYLGRQSKIDDILFRKGLPVAEKIVKLFQDIIESELYYYKFYQSNLSGFPTIDEAIHNFENLPGNYQKDYERIQLLMENREKLYEELKIARLYIKPNLLDDIKKYLDLGVFHYLSTAFTWDNFFEGFLVILLIGKYILQEID